MSLRKLTVITGMALAMLLGSRAVAAGAEGGLSYSSFQVLVWPEYDDPRLLVQLQGQVAAGTPLPQEAVFYVPLGVEVYSACNVDAEGSHTPADHAVEEAGDGWAVVSLQLNQPNFHVEYYDDVLRGRPVRETSVTFRAPAPIDSLTFVVQEPLSAQRFQLDPEPTVSAQGGQDFTYYHYVFQGVGEGELKSFRMSYVKSDDRPSVDPSASQAGPNPAPSWAVWTALAAGVVTVAGLAWAVSRGGRGAPAHGKKPAGRRKPAEAPPAGAPGGFCPSCGQARQPGDRYCGHCGQPVI